MKHLKEDMQEEERSKLLNFEVLKIVDIKGENMSLLEPDGELVLLSGTFPVIHLGGIHRFPEHERTVSKQKLQLLGEKKKDGEIQGLLEESLDKIPKSGIVLLDPMGSRARKQIHKAVQELSQVTSFSIGEGLSRRVVLRTHRPLKQSVEEKLFVHGREAYRRGNYDLCIRNYRLLLAGEQPDMSVYYRLGVAYQKIGRLDLAIDYLTVANELSKVEKRGIHLTKLIHRLQKEVSTNGISTEERESLPAAQKQSVQFPVRKLLQLAIVPSRRHF